VPRIPEITSRDRRVVTDLFTHKARFLSALANLPDEYFSKEGVKRLLDAVLGVAAGVLLAAQRG
jgi:hypothetical protein